MEERSLHKRWVAMHMDVFGDLREWGDVLDKLGELRTAEALDDHQHGLARLIRCRDNWRLREEALLSAAQIRSACRPLVDATLGSLQDPEESLDNRILAAQALGSMLAPGASALDPEIDFDEVLSTMQGVLDDGSPPVLRAALRGACSRAAGNLG